eukprot:SAG22_NODE_8185_length_676_cov_0.993068_1_plen_109_part_00
MLRRCMVKPAQWSILVNIYIFSALLKIAVGVALLVVTATTDTSGCEIDMTVFYVYPCLCILIGVIWGLRAAALRKVVAQARQESLLPTAVASSSVVPPTAGTMKVGGE